MIKELIIYILLTGIGFLCGMLFGSMAKEQEQMQKQIGGMPPGEEELMGIGDFPLDEVFEGINEQLESSDEYSLFE